MRKPELPVLTDRQIVRALWPEGQVVRVWKGGQLWKAKFAPRSTQIDLILKHEYVEPLLQSMNDPSLLRTRLPDGT